MMKIKNETVNVIIMVLAIVADVALIINIIHHW
jgi:hypothetical protein